MEHVIVAPVCSIRQAPLLSNWSLWDTICDATRIWQLVAGEFLEPSGDAWSLLVLGLAFWCWVGAFWCWADLLSRRINLHFSQDPNSQHLGTTVWDASMVLAKYLERNCRRDRFSPSKLKGKRVIELGAGCGVAGFGMALLGCDVITTDQKEVLPLLSRNVDSNISRIAQGDSSSGCFGSIKVAELDWGNEDHIRAVVPPFDYIIGTDVVYTEHLLEALLKTIFALSEPKTTILLGHEIRSTAVHEQMLELWKKHFEAKSIPKSKMDIRYQHPSIQLYDMNPKASTTTTEESVHRYGETKTGLAPPKDDEETCCVLNTESFRDDDVLDDSNLEKLCQGKLSDWKTRRCGSMAASLLKDVKIS